jgi:hypothetical protein
MLLGQEFWVPFEEQSSSVAWEKSFILLGKYDFLFSFLVCRYYIGS